MLTNVCRRFEYHVCSPSLSLICLVNLDKSALQKQDDKIITAYCNVVVPGFTDLADKYATHCKWESKVFKR